MAFKYREDIVGKRFLSVRSSTKLKVSKISEWEWRSGVVRAVSSRDVTNKDISVLVEFDDCDWKRREWVKIHGIFQVFLVESTLIWTERSPPVKSQARSQHVWPALNFRIIVDKSALSGSRKRPVEFLVDRQLSISDEKDIKPYQEGDDERYPIAKARPDVLRAIKKWIDYQDGQKILLTTPSVLVGYRIEVYRAEGTTQWYTAVIQSYHHTTKTLSVTDDTVLEEHNESPVLIQMRLIDDGIVDSILRGVEVGIVPRRRPRQLNKDKEHQQPTVIYSRNRSQSPIQTPPNKTPVRKSRQRNASGGSLSSVTDSEKGSEKISTRNTSRSQNQRERKRKPEELLPEELPSTPSPSNSKRNKNTESSKVQSRVKENVDTSVNDAPVAKPPSDEELLKKKQGQFLRKKLKKETPTPAVDSPRRNEEQDLKLTASRNKKRKSLTRSTEPEVSDNSNEDVKNDVNSKDNTLDKTEDIESCPVEPEPPKTSEKKAQSDTEDNTGMHYKKLALLAGGNTQEQPPKSHSSASSNPISKSVRRASLSSSVSSSEELSNARLSEDRPSSGLSGDERRPGSHFNDLRGKNSPASSPLYIVDRNEHVLPYRDPELMRKNTVLSNVQSMLGHGPHKSTSYPAVHTPIPSQSTGGISAAAVAASPTLPNHPLPRTPVVSSIPYPQMIPAHVGLLDHAAIAALQQQQIASQYSGRGLLPMFMPGDLSRTQLELLWQQKYPSVPVPPPWLLVKYQDDLLRDVALYREQQLERDRREREQIERERLERERIERERIEHDRRLERERQEKERQERERIEREKAEKERAEKERAEKERAERDRAEKERERLERERQERNRLEREQRILGETIDSKAAVDQHFLESFRLASQRAGGPGMWTSAPSITRGTSGKATTPKPDAPNMNAAHQGYMTSSRQDEVKHESLRYAEEKMKQNKERGDFLRRKQQEELYAQRHQEEIMKQQQLIKESKAKENLEHAKGEPKSESLSKGDNPQSYGYPYYMSSGGQRPSKQEQPNYSLYGYQPFQHSYISTEQLQSYGLVSDKHKESKSQAESKMRYNSPIPPGGTSLPSPKKRDISIPPPLIKDHSQQSSVIVENKESAKHTNFGPYSNPLPAHSPRMQPKPAHTPERYTDRSLHSSSSPVSAPAAHRSIPQTIPSSIGLSAHQAHYAALRTSDSKHLSRSQSPLRVASPNQLSAAVMQPMDYRNPASKSRTNPQSDSTSGSSSSSAVSSGVSTTVSSSYIPAIAQPPVSLPQSSVPYSCSLIQQGLVPNPIYTQNSNSSLMTSKGNSLSQNSPHDHSPSIPVQGPVSSPSSMPPTSAMNTTHPTGVSQQVAAGVKRKVNRDGINRKRQKPAVDSPGVSSMPLSIPVTTPQIFTNASPYTTTSSTTLTSSPATSLAATTISPSFPSPTSAFSQSTKTTGYFDSFKTFVENTVHNAFFRDPDLNRQKQSPYNQSQEHQQPPLQPLLLSQLQQNVPQQLSNPQNPTTQAENLVIPLSSASAMHDEMATNLSSSSASSHASYMETINRVANGQLDTDSDTLSAPSPPPQIKSDSSPHKSEYHPKLKKAWLQRHSDEDKEKESKNLPLTPEQGETSKELVRNCYVNCSYISPSKEGGAKSPISAFVLPNGGIKEMNSLDESTSSASEAEILNSDNTAPQKRRKTKKTHSSMKKLKVELEEGEVPSSAGAPRKKSPVKRNKEGKDKKCRQNAQETTVEEAKIISKERVKIEDNITQHPETVHIKQEVETSDVKEEIIKQEISIKTEEEPAVVKKEEVKKEQMNENEQPNSTSQTIKPKKRGPRTKESKQNLQETKNNIPSQSPTPAQSQRQPQPQTQSSGMKPLVKASVALLKKTCDPFLQEGPCADVTPKLMKCRECKMTPTQRSKKLPNIFCRFYAFRRLRYSHKGYLTIAGFSELDDADAEDLAPWMPKYPVMHPELDIETSKYIIAKVGDKFCELVEQEKEAKSWIGNKDSQIAWKRAVTGIREMCDVCDTTLFNMHWVCHKCGFVVCLDCYKVKVREIKKESGMEEEDDSSFVEEKRHWLTCSSSRTQHEVDKLMLTQIIPKDALWEVGRLIHDMREKWVIPAKCPCGKSNIQPKAPKNGVNQQLMQRAINHLTPEKGKKMVNGVGQEHFKVGKNKKEIYNDNTSSLNGNIKSSVNALTGYTADNTSPLSLLADVASMDSESSRERSESPMVKRKSDTDKLGLKSYNPITEPVSPCGGGGDGEKKTSACSTLRELLTKTAGKVKNLGDGQKKPKQKQVTNSLDDIIQSVVEKQKDSDVQPMKLMHYVPRYGYRNKLVRDTPILIHNLTETSVLYPDVPHSWLCDGRLLRLHDPKHKGNFRIFQEQWKRGQPVLVSGVDKCLDRELWKPATFRKQFGHLKNDLVNCRTGVVMIGHPMSDFWDGLECLGERLLDENDETMLLKLKDWPPGDDFSDILPSHFDDLMQTLPLPEYTHRTGQLNLASRLPDFFVRPDLGPKMYNAYGSASYPKEGTTNLHLDVSDAVNVMCYVGIPSDGPGGRAAHEAAAIKSIDDAGCDIITKRRIREIHEIPGALWHIYDAQDADKMRDFLNKVAKERGEVIEPHHDPIHDQSWYLDEELRNRLYKEYGVLGYTIVQCLGDAMFIPAGAPHQVRNIHSCIKVAEDFVSPEHLNHCFAMTQEFRLLSSTHSNHEDKLQVKNIIYHAVKDAVAVLNEEECEEDSD
ncbi:hypothetical protein ScPMuIL_001634 [Solemya velum]